MQRDRFPTLRSGHSSRDDAGSQNIAEWWAAFEQSVSFPIHRGDVQEAGVGSLELPGIQLDCLCKTPTPGGTDGGIYTEGDVGCRVF